MATTVEQIDEWRKAPRENQQLEFKEAKNSFDNEKLYKYCVAIANEGGGKLLLGVADKSPRSVVGSNSYRDTVKTAERIFEAVKFRVDVEEVKHPGGRVLVFHIPARPTGTAYNLDGAYLMRSGSQLVAMSEDRLRSIFAEGSDKHHPQQSTMLKQAQSWRDKRLQMIVENDAPIKLASKSAIVLHLVPRNSLSNSTQIPPDRFQQPLRLPLLDVVLMSHQFNTDGFLLLESNPEHQESSDAYVQLFRTGIIEAVSCWIIYRDGGGDKIDGPYVERGVVQSVQQNLKCLKSIDIQLPIVLFLSVVGAKGATLESFRTMLRFSPRPYNSNMVVGPAIYIEDFDIDVPAALRPAFDILWNASGYPGSLSYDKNDVWRPSR
jgi:hypothetical protein